METVFLNIVKMSITASYVILLIIVARVFLRKAPKIFSYAIWIVVLFRLVCPVSFESIFSLLPGNRQTLGQSVVYSQVPKFDASMVGTNQLTNTALPITPRVLQEISVNPVRVWLSLGEIIWLIGFALLLSYSLYTTIKLSGKIKTAKLKWDNVYEIRGLKTPFVFGIANPKIYLPIDLAGHERSYIIKHEQTHIKRFDHIIKPIAFFIVSLHWFNPLVWIAFFLMSEDMELSCDESVIKQMGSHIKKDYSTSLLSLSTERRIIGGHPLAFVEGNTKKRIMNILNYKRPKFMVIILAFVAVVVLGFGLISNPQNKQDILQASAGGDSSQNTINSKERAEGLGFEELWFILGTPMEDIIREYGEPIKQELDYNHHIGGNIIKLIYDFGEISFVPSYDEEDKMLLSSFITQSSSFIGPYGIKVGDTVESIFEEFPKNKYEENYIKGILGVSPTVAFGQNVDLIYLSQDRADIGIITYNSSRQITSVEYIKNFETGGATRLRFKVKKDKISEILIMQGYM